MADNEMVEGIYRNTNGYGINGIEGMHHQMLGWDNTTVGMASSVFDNLLTQNGIRSNDPNYLGALEPIRTGKFIVKWLKVPPFFDDIAVKYLKFFLENAVKQVDNIQSNQLSESGTLTFGANGQEMSFPGQIKENNKTVTLTTITCTGDGLGKLIRYWQYGITDPITQVHHLYGKNMRFIRPNYSGTLMYIFLGPTARPGDIEYSCIWHEVWPSSPDGKDKWNSNEIGNDQSIGDQQVELNGIFQDGPECNILAKYIVAGAGLAGQSYFDQVLPAYMYTKYVKGIREGDIQNNETIRGISMRQQHKLEAQADIYDEEVNGVRSEIVGTYGLDTEDIPSRYIEKHDDLKGISDFNLSDLSLRSESNKLKG